MPSLKVRVAAAVALAIALPLSATACGGGGGGGGGGDTIVIGTKFDQPGLGLKNPDGTMSGFDVDVAKYVAKQLGFNEDKIEWKESPSGQRETLIQNDQVKFIAATYSITDARKEKVDFAGPYLITGQSLLVKADNTDITGAESLQNNKKLCSVSGSTPAQRIKDKYPGVQLQQYDTYSACVEALKNGAIDAVTTDEVILAGYAAQSPGAFKIVGKPFSEERYGIGLKKGDTELRTKINDAITKMEQDGAWKAAFEKNLGPAGIPRRRRRRSTSNLTPARTWSSSPSITSQIFEAFWTTIQLTVYLRHRSADPRHGAGRDAAVAGADAQLDRDDLRQRGAQHPADADHPVLLVRTVPDARHHAGGSEVADVDRGQQLPVGGARVDRLHRGVRL